MLTRDLKQYQHKGKCKLTCDLEAPQTHEPSKSTLEDVNAPFGVRSAKTRPVCSPQTRHTSAKEQGQRNTRPCSASEGCLREILKLPLNGGGRDRLRGLKLGKKGAALSQ